MWVVFLKIESLGVSERLDVRKREKSSNDTKVSRSSWFTVGPFTEENEGGGAGLGEGRVDKPRCLLDIQGKTLSRQF